MIPRWLIVCIIVAVAILVANVLGIVHIHGSVAL